MIEPCVQVNSKANYDDKIKITEQATGLSLKEPTFVICTSLFQNLHVSVFLTIPSTLIRFPVPGAPKHPHTIILPLWDCVLWVIGIPLFLHVVLRIFHSGLKVPLLPKWSFTWSANLLCHSLVSWQLFLKQISH